MFMTGSGMETTAFATGRVHATKAVRAGMRIAGAATFDFLLLLRFFLLFSLCSSSLFASAFAELDDCAGAAGAADLSCL